MAKPTQSLQPPETPKGAVTTEPVERGASGTENFSGYITGEEYNPALAPPQCFRVYDEMRMADPNVQASLEIVKTPLMSANWTVQPPKDPTPQEQEVADFCQSALFERGAMADPWKYFLEHALAQLDFGVMPFELVWTLGQDKRIRLNRLAPRLPKTVQRWYVDEEKGTGALKSMEQLAMKGGKIQTLTMLADSLAVFVRRREGDNWWGRSILRSAYKPWYYLNQAEKAEAVRLFRYGVGVPMASRDKDYNPQIGELEKVQATVKGLVSHERAFIVTHTGWTWSILTPSGGSGGDPGARAAIEGHSKAIMRNVLAEFMAGGPDGLNSGRTRTLANVFTSQLYATSEDIAGVLDLRVLRPLCTYNFPMEAQKLRYPSVVANDVTDVDVKQMADILARLCAIKIVTPDDDLEGFLRELLGVPAMQEESKGKSRDRVAVPAPTDKDKKDPDVDVETEPAEPGGPEPTVTAKTSLNGAQVTAVLEILERVTMGRLPREVGIRVIVTAFNVDEAIAEDLMGEVGRGFVPTPPATEPAPAPQEETQEEKAARALRDARPAIAATKASRVFTLDGRDYCRQPTTFELRVFSLGSVPDRLDSATSAVVSSLAGIRKLQLEKLASQIAKKDARATTGEFTDLRPSQFSVSLKADVERVLKTALQEVANFGATEVRLELERQLKDRNQELGITLYVPTPPLAQYSLEHFVLAGAGKNKSIAKSALTTSAKVATETETDYWFNRVLETATRMRRGGTQGDDLANAIQQALLPELETGLKALAKGELNEAFSIGRATEATQLSDQIGEVEYSCLLDANSCDKCVDEDGKTFAFESAEYFRTLPPFKDCDGNKGRPDACRCVHLYHLK